MSSYVSLVTGPRRRGEEDGPEAFHLVVLDNGRSRILREPKLREALYCIRCGACLNACPVYRHAGGHAYGWVYSGPIGSVITPSLVGGEKARDLPFASSLCGACESVCPVRIELPRLLLEQRARLAARPRPGWRKGVERLLVRGFVFLTSSPDRFRLGSRFAYWLARPFSRKGRLRHLPFLSPWTRFRDFPAPARRSFRDRWEER